MKYAILALVACLAWAVSGATMPADTVTGTQPAETKVSLITIYPGSEVYELYGHTELRVRTAESDMFYNYGLFDFTAPGFTARFIAGETDYLCGAIPPDLALSGYAGRKVVEQELALTPKEAAAIRDYSMPLIDEGILYIADAFHHEQTLLLRINRLVILVMKDGFIRTNTHVQVAILSRLTKELHMTTMQ